MPKSRKTRKEKIAASLKHQQPDSPITYSLPTVSSAQTSPLLKHPVSSIQTVVFTDLQKTFFISIFIIFAELLLFYLLHQHIVKLPFASY